ncbi:hypothetical protein SCUP234_02784 [Seiridium cupressi]
MPCHADLANVVGTEEPIYGPSAIRSVAEDAKTTPYTELKKEDLQWQELDSTSVETQTFYLMSDDGVHLGLAQVIYSNVAGIKTTVQFNSKITYLDGSKPPLWCSNPVSDVAVSEDKLNFYAKDCAIELSEDGNSYTIKSMTDQRCIVNLKVTKAAPGFVVGKDGKTLYGTDLKNPWGYIRHAFWPRCVAEGSMMTKDGPVDFKGLAFLTHAMQGMKPHHAAGKWNFVDFQGPTYSAILMQHTTPPSYGTTTVTVGGIAKDGEIIIANAACTATHLKTQSDSENAWPEPKDVRFTWSGTTKDGKAVEATIEGTFEKRVDRVDVMAEVPVFVKKIVAGAAGTKPYIYMYAPLDFVLQLKIGDETFSEKGKTFSEATFISDTDAAQAVHDLFTIDVMAGKSAGWAQARGKGAKGIGLGGKTGAKRHRKILRDNIQGVTKGAIRRLARRGGVKRISATIYDEVRSVMKSFLEEVLKDCATYCDYRRAKTITTTDVLYALKRRGRPIYGFDDGYKFQQAGAKKR